VEQVVLRQSTTQAKAPVAVAAADQVLEVEAVLGSLALGTGHCKVLELRQRDTLVLGDGDVLSVIL
jgi:hypothetical protein